MSAYFHIIRPVNLVIIIATQLLLRFCVIEVYLDLSDLEPVLAYTHLALLVLSTVLIAAGGYIINDIYDRKIDAAANPDRILPVHEITTGNAWKYYGVLTGLGIAAGIYLAFVVDFLILGLLFPAVAMMLWLYSARYQKKVVLGNVMISLLSAMVILVLWLFEFFALNSDPIKFVDAMKQIVIIQRIVAGYAIFAFFVSLIREIVKDIEDREGDKSGGYLTLPVVYGVVPAKRLAVIIHLFTMAFLGLALVYLYQSNLMFVFWYLAVAVLLLFFFVFYQLVMARSEKDFHFLSNAYKLIMLAGILSMQLFYISF